MADETRAHQIRRSMIDCIVESQRALLGGGNPNQVMVGIVASAIEVSGSEFGFVAEVNNSVKAKPVLVVRAIVDTTESQQLKQWEEVARNKPIAMADAGRMIGEAIETKCPVYGELAGSNVALSDLPARHPDAKSFVMIPFTFKGTAGVVGLANRPGGYDSDLVALMQPLVEVASFVETSISERDVWRSAASDLEMTSARVVAIMEAVSDPLIVINERGLVDSFNEAAVQTFGYQVDEVVGKNVSMLMNNDDAGDHDGHLSRYLRTGKKTVLGARREVIGKRKDGSLFPLELSVRQVDVSGENFYAGTCRDLTSVKLASRQLGMYSATIEATPDFVAVAGPDGFVQAINKAGRKILGIGPNEEIGEFTLSDIQAPVSRTLVEKVGLPTALRDGSWTGETSFIGSDGVAIPMSQVLVVSRDSDGEVEQISTIARDLTETKEIERVKGEFVSTVSHELRTPLTSIRGSLGLVVAGAMGEVSEQALRMVTLAQSNTDRLIKLINDILDFEKAQSGAIEVNVNLIDPIDVVTQACQSVEGAASEAGVTIEVSTPEGAKAPIMADADRLVQVLINLLSNAIKFSDEGAKVELSLECRDSDTRFRVVDHGTGIGEDQLEKIFLPFHQADSSDRRKVGGTGLGLSIAKSITEAHGGSIDLSSQPGEGTTVSVVIPTTNDLLGVDERAVARPHVLIAEHDLSTRIITRRLLEGEGMRCAEVTDGNDVVQQVQELDPHVLLLDIGLPSLDGFKVVDQLRDGGHESLPLIVYTGRDLTVSERSDLKLGPTRHLTKARVGEQEVVAKVSELLSGSAS